MGPNTSTPELVDSTHPGLKPTWLHQTKKLPLKIAVHSQVTMETMVVGMKVVIMVTTMTNARLNATVTTMEVKVTTTTKKTMMVLMMVRNKVALLVKSLALTANANVNMKTWSAGKSAMSATRLTSVATMPTREMILTKEITEKMRAR